MRRTAVLAAATVGLSLTGISSAAQQGRPPTPAQVYSYYQGGFSDPRWEGALGIVVSADGRTVTSIVGVAPGPCEDEEFGPLVPGRDGATGARFALFAPARIRDDGDFAVSERRSGVRRPYKGSYALTVRGTFAGNVVRGRVRGTVTTPFDRCTADVAFTARRVSD